MQVWSDDATGVMRKNLSEQELREIFYIEYNHSNLVDELRKVENDLLDFYECWIQKTLWMIDAYDKEQLFKKYCQWLHLTAAGT